MATMGLGLHFPHTEDGLHTRMVRRHHHYHHLTPEEALSGVTVSFLGAYMFPSYNCITRLIAHATHRGGKITGSNTFANKYTTSRTAVLRHSTHFLHLLATFAMWHIGSHLLAHTRLSIIVTIFRTTISPATGLKLFH